MSLICFVMNFFGRLLKSSWTLTELQDTKKRISTGIYMRQTDSFPCSFFFFINKRVGKRYLRFRLDQLKSVNLNSFLIN